MKEAFDATRSEGASIDRELIVILADETVQATRPTQEEHERPEFTKDWARKWAKHHQLTKKIGTIDRPPCTIEDLVEDNAWRQKLLDIMERPAAFGIHMPDGYSRLLPTLVYACDETVTDMRGTYENEGVNRVFLMNQGEKRQGTATPIVDMNGDTLCLQVIFRGKTTACHAKTTKIAHLVHTVILQVCPPPPFSSLSFPFFVETQLADRRSFFWQDHSKAKAQDGVTWKRLLRDVHEKNQVKLKDLQLPVTFPVLMVADRASAHLTAAGVEEVRGPEVCEDLVKMTDSGIYMPEPQPRK